jgi:hypothetical protein
MNASFEKRGCILLGDDKTNPTMHPHNIMGVVLKNPIGEDPDRGEKGSQRQCFMQPEETRIQTHILLWLR